MSKGDKLGMTEWTEKGRRYMALARRLMIEDLGDGTALISVCDSRERSESPGVIVSLKQLAVQVDFVKEHWKRRGTDSGGLLAKFTMSGE